MAPSASTSAQITLTYPLYVCAFDPADPNLLIVGGGGGPGRDGVGNKLTLLDASTPSSLAKLHEHDLLANEDNVTSLAAGPRVGAASTLFAGVNSNPDHVKGGAPNTHFRILALTHPDAAAAAPRSNKSNKSKSKPKPAATKTSGEYSSAELSRDSLFLQPPKDINTYQRLVRLSAPFPSASAASAPAQLGAVATGFADSSQIALFDVPAAGPARWKSRGRLEIPREAMDLDVVQTGPKTYQLAYCDDHKLYTVEVSPNAVSVPRLVYTLTPDSPAARPPSFKSLRYLTSGFVVTVVNQPGSGGVDVHGYRLPKSQPQPDDDDDEKSQSRSQPLSSDQQTARLAIKKKLPKSVGKATGFAVQNLSPASSPDEKQGDAQFVVAVAGNDSSISLYTLEHKTAHDVDLLADLAPFQHIKSAHASNITGLTFSTFIPPKSEDPSSPQPKISVKLASVAVGNTTVVHDIPLKRYEDKAAPVKKGDPPRQPRYVVAAASSSGAASPLAGVGLLTLVILLLAVLGQVFLEAKGITSTPVLGARNILPAAWTSPIFQHREAPAPMAVVEKTIGDLLADARQTAQDAVAGAESADTGKPIVIRHDVPIREDDSESQEKSEQQDGDSSLPDLHVGVHDEEAHGPATAWEDLGDRERHLWKERLKRTGHWAENMGESVFKGVLFGQLGGAVGHLVGEALR